MLSPAGTKRFLRVVDGGAFSSFFYYTIADSRILFERFDPPEGGVGRSTLAVRKEVKLTPGDAAELWRKIGALGIDRWKERYEPKDLGVEVFDGTDWQIFLRVDAKEKHSSGFNVYPATSPLGAPILEVNERGKPVRSAYHQLRELLHERTKG
jgi:hypothetical protein